jgi:hypothetical protein
MMSRSQRHKVVAQGLDSSGRRAPLATARPTFSGTNTVGSLQTGVPATFTGFGTITVTNAWVRDNTEIPGATGTTYTLVAGDSGKAIRFRSKATSPFGTANVGPVISDSNPRTVP